MNRYYTTFEAARLLGVSLPTVVNWIKARRLKAHRTPGGHRRISREDLAAFMVRHGMPLPADLDDAAHARRKALVIDEAGPAREGTARRLAAAGYAIDQASPGFPAGAAAARFAPDVIVIHAASGDGGELLRAIRADRELATTPVVAIGHPDWTAPLREAGCAEAVARPPPDGVLEEAIASALSAGRRRGGADGGRAPTSAHPSRLPRRQRSD
jgi:excisionase family DNA binding protein